jgi:GrpB-like predicted nucleotidyltransferase (UPF0157 family)
MKKYKFREYNKKFPKFFEKEKIRLERIFPKSLLIEHIGSTSIPGLGGKGIVDVLLVVNKKNISRTKELLILEGYTYMKDSLHPSRLSFYRDYWKFFGKRRVHVHLTYLNSRTYRETLRFKRLLLNNKELVREYGKIKKKAVVLAKGEGKVYRAYKKSFVEKHSRSLKSF